MDETTITIDNIHLSLALMHYITDPKNPMYNFNLGKCYDDLGHTASAASYYLRTAEYSDDKLLSYEALLRMSLCFQKQGSRIFTTKGVLLRAISLLPKRPEAYFLLSRIYEINREWQESYTWAVIGEELLEESDGKLLTNVEYPGKYGFTFEKSISSWYIGLFDESVHLSYELAKNPNMLEIHSRAVKNNITNLGIIWKDPILYNNSLYEHMRVKFSGLINIQSNYSQCYQDLFALTMLNGKRNGLYLEIGCGDPFYGNNTALLEKEFGWTGISIDADLDVINNFTQSRSGKIVLGDATKIDYNKLLNNNVYDYLQIDCEPAISSYLTLLKMPLETHKFAVITFEHDFYIDEKSGVREKSRKYLESHGYVLVVNNVAPDKFSSFEDWWVHPDLVDRKIIDKMKCISDSPKKCDDYMLGKI